MLSDDARHSKSASDDEIHSESAFDKNDNVVDLEKNEIIDITCPITGEIMLDPVIIGSGHSYERIAIEKWFETHNTCPKSNEILTNKTITINFALRSIIESRGHELIKLTDSDFVKKENIEEKEKQKIHHNPILDEFIYQDEGQVRRQAQNNNRPDSCLAKICYWFTIFASISMITLLVSGLIYGKNKDVNSYYIMIVSGSIFGFYYVFTIITCGTFMDLATTYAHYRETTR